MGTVVQAYQKQELNLNFKKVSWNLWRLNNNNFYFNNHAFKVNSKISIERETVWAIQ